MGVVLPGGVPRVAHRVGELGHQRARRVGRELDAHRKAVELGLGDQLHQTGLGGRRVEDRLAGVVGVGLGGRVDLVTGTLG